MQEMSKITELEQAIAALEKQRDVIGADIVDAALSSMRAELAQLKGQTRPPEHQRKLLTILFMDIVGSTRLTQGLDPEEVLEIMDGALKALAAPVEKYNGRVTRFMGDGFIAIFGLPLAQEDDAERAVLAGLDILQVARRLSAQFQSQRQLPGCEVRVGINTGLVATGGFSEAEDTVMGLTVNLAARMEQAAPPGGVLISQQTFKLVRAGFEVQPVPPVSAKGFEQPVPAYLVQRARSHPFLLPAHSVRGQETRLIGRAAKLQRLQEAFAAAQDQSLTQFVTLVGDAGLGKSRLLTEFSNWLDLQSSPVTYFKGRAVRHTSAMPFSLLRNIFAERLHINDGDSVNHVRQKLEGGLAAYLSDETFMKAHFIGALLGLEFSDSPYLAGVRDDSQQLRQRALFYISEYISALARQYPIVAFLDDIHLADPPSLEAIVGLAERCSKTHLLIIASARPELYKNTPDWDERLGAMGFLYRRVDLEPFSRQQAEELVGEILRTVEDLPTRLVQQIVTISEGNPYYIEELIRVLMDDGVILIPESQANWQVDTHKLQQLRIPSTLTALLQARLDSLPPVEKAFLQQAAVVGRIFWRGVLHKLQGDPDLSARLLKNLVERELILPGQSASLDDLQEYVFKSAIMQEVVYDTVPIRQRKKVHAAVADWLIAAMSPIGRVDEYAGLIADHFARAEDRNQAADWFMRAGERALAQGAPVEACSFADRALQYLPKDNREGRWRALLIRDEVLGLLGETDACQADDESLIALAQAKQNEEWLAEAYRRRAFHLHNTGDEVQALQFYDLAVQSARRSQNPSLLAKVLALKVISLVRTGELDQAQAAAQEALQVIRDSNDPPTQARVYTNLAAYYSETGDIAKAITIFHRAHEIADQLDERVGKTIILGNLGYNYLKLGQYSEGLEMLEQALEAAHSMDARYQVASIRLNLGLARFLSHEPQPAARLLEQSLEELGQIGDRFGMAAGNFYLGLAMEQAGDCSSAEAHFRTARDLYTQVGLPGFAHDALAGLARCYLAHQETSRAMDKANQIWETLSASGAAGMEFPILAYLTCAQIYLASGDQKTARQIVAAGHAELKERAEKISDPQWRSVYLSNVPEHRQLFELENLIADHSAGGKI
jgi:class 3 adenylate cyclase/tetratricopeptide (TPR) repeat protein